MIRIRFTCSNKNKW